MFGVDKDAFVFLGHVIPVTSADHARLDIPFAAQINENGAALRLELVVN